MTSTHTGRDGTGNSEAENFLAYEQFGGQLLDLVDACSEDTASRFLGFQIGFGQSRTSLGATPCESYNSHLASSSSASVVHPFDN